VKPATDGFVAYAEGKTHGATVGPLFQVTQQTLRRDISPPRMTVRVTPPVEKASVPLGSLAQRFMVDPSAMTWNDVKTRIMQESATKV